MWMILLKIPSLLKNASFVLTKHLIHVAVTFAASGTTAKLAQIPFSFFIISHIEDWVLF